MSAPDLTEVVQQILAPSIGPHHCTECGHRVLGIDPDGRCAICGFFGAERPRPDLTIADSTPSAIDQQAFERALEHFKAVYRRVFAAAAVHAGWVMDREEAHQEATREALEAFLGAYLDEVSQ